MTLVHAAYIISASQATVQTLHMPAFILLNKSYTKLKKNL